MKQKILPSVMAKSQKEIDFLFNKLDGVSKHLHLDVADGKFVPNKSLWFPFKLSSKFNYSAHLMVKDPSKWIKKYGRRVDLIIFHSEAVKNVSVVIEEIKAKKKNVGLALKPETKIKGIEKELLLVDYILILTVHPGFYGAKFLKSPLKKIQQIKKINSKVKIIVDGGMKPGNIELANKLGSDYFISGSFVSKSENPKKSIKELRALIK